VVLTAIGELAQPVLLPLLKMMFPEVSILLSVCMIDMFQHMNDALLFWRAILPRSAGFVKMGFIGPLPKCFIVHSVNRLFICIPR
jgi:hypothetical protein